jgi:DNA polymerase III epsilon subunit-like protein
MHPQQDFIVIDTEGKKELREIAIIDSQGKLIYEAFTREHPDNYEKVLNLKPLREIVVDFLEIAKTKLIIFHYAKHDIQILKNSCSKVGLPWQNFAVKCSCELAKASFPGLASYSLEYLSKHLNLKVNQSYFDVNLAHIARYDAEFTYQLYLKLMAQAPKDPRLDTLRDKPNPFGSSRVDNPFQDHVDLKEIYQDEFEILKSVITDIKHDKNHQSKGTVVIGEPGSGKTHLMMRLAKELLKVNRLLFIRQPNNPDSVLYHTYSRILESFFRKVIDTPYTQLEYLLANSFVKLISSTKIMTLHKKDQEILAAGKKNKLDLYESLGAEGTQRKREYWQHIEKRTNEWWANQYGVAGYSAQILKGIVKYCSYSEPRRKELVARWLSAHELTQEEAALIGLNNWNDEMSREAFSLEAIAVFSKLSLLDEPLIIIFDQLEALGYEYNQRLLMTFGESVKEIFTHVPNSLIILNLFPERWEQFKKIFDGAVIDRVSQYQIHLQRPTNEKLQEILQLNAQATALNIETIFDSAELENILNQKSIRAVLNKASDYYKHKVNNVPLPRRDESQRKQEGKETLQERLNRLENETHVQQRAISKLREESEIGTGIQTRLEALENELIKLQEKFSKEIKDIFIKLDELEGKGGGGGIELPSVIRYLQEQRGLLEEEFKNPQIISDSDDLGRLRTIAEAFKRLKDFNITELRLGNRVLPAHLVISNDNQSYAIGFLQIGAKGFVAKIQNWNELALRYKEITFELFRDQRQPEIKGTVSLAEIQKLKNSINGNFSIMDKNNRISFELIYKLINDIQNRDVELELEEALQDLIAYINNCRNVEFAREETLQVLMSSLDTSWLINLFEQFETI